MIKVIFTFVLSLFILPHATVAETFNCGTSSCEAMGYTTDAKKNCQSDLIVCPFDSKYTKCIKKFTCSELGFIEKTKYRGTCSEYSACPDDPNLFLCKKGSIGENICLKQYPGTSHNQSCSRKGGVILTKQTSDGINWVQHPNYHKINDYEYCGVCFKCPSGYYKHNIPLDGVPDKDIRLYGGGIRFICDPCANPRIEKYRCDNLNGVFAKDSYEDGADGVTCGKCLYNKGGDFYAFGDMYGYESCTYEVFTGEDDKTYTRCYNSKDGSSKCPLGKVSQEMCATWGGLEISSPETSNGVSCVECFTCPLTGQDYLVADGELEGMTCVNTVAGADGQTHSCCNFENTSGCGDAEQLSDISAFNTAGAKCLSKNLTYNLTEYPSGINDDSLYILRPKSAAYRLTVTGKLPRLYSSTYVILNKGAQIKELAFFGKSLTINAPLALPGNIKIFSSSLSSRSVSFGSGLASSSAEPSTISCGKNLSNITFSFTNEDVHLQRPYKIDASCQGVKCKLNNVEGKMSADGLCVTN